MKTPMKYFKYIVSLFFVALLVNSAMLHARAFDSSQDSGRYLAQVSIPVARGVRIYVDNRTTGRITVRGWDRDVVEARAGSSRGDEVVIVKRDETDKQIGFKADYADFDQPSAPTSHLKDPPVINDEVLKVNLIVNVPRWVELGLIEVIRSDVEVTGVETQVSVSAGRSSVLLKNVGSAEVQSKSGNVEIEGISGAGVVLTSSGAIRISDSKSAVRAVSIAGPIEIKCSEGRVDVSNAEAPIELVNINGDVDAIATNSSVRFTGKLRDGGRYYLKSMSGRVEMLLPANPSGFTATLSSYRGLVESAFSLHTKQAPSDAAHNRRRTGTYGNGKAQITLDSFEGMVRLTKLDTMPGCQK